MRYNHQQIAACKEFLNRVGFEKTLNHNTLAPFQDAWDNLLAMFKKDEKTLRSVLSKVRRDAGHRIQVRVNSPVNNITLSRDVNFCPRCGFELKNLAK